jgi:hypothetical protein
MAYTLPVFNVSVNIWHSATYIGNFPTVIPPPDLVVTCNLALGKRMNNPVGMNMWLLLPAATDIRDGVKAVTTHPFGDIVEAPAGSGRYYFVVNVDDAGKGFANEHRVAEITFNLTFMPLLPEWPVPFP